MCLLTPVIWLPLVASASSSAPEPGVSTATYIQTLLALLLIVGLLGATAWLARKISGGKGFGQGGMRVIGGVALGPKERIVLLEVGEQWLVVGIVPGQIRTLHTLARGELQTLPSLEQTDDKSFANWLKQVMERRGNV